MGPVSSVLLFRSSLWLSFTKDLTNAQSNTITDLFDAVSQKRDCVLCLNTTSVPSAVCALTGWHSPKEALLLQFRTSDLFWEYCVIYYNWNDSLFLSAPECFLSSGHLFVILLSKVFFSLAILLYDLSGLVPQYLQFITLVGLSCNRVWILPNTNMSLNIFLLVVEREGICVSQQLKEQ